MKDLLVFLQEWIAIPEDIVFREIPGSGLCNITDHCIEYTGKREALRGLGLYLAGERGTFRCSFKTLGVMYDCSRNGVPEISWLKRQFVGLALLGYNQFQMYMEDTYQCPGEPLFGYGRGAYSLEELQELDDFGSKLGIEVCSAIQTLGHMENLLKFGSYSAVSDTPRILLADEEKTYELIEKMISFQSRAFRSRRINLGLDEAVGLGQGKHLEKFGPENPFDIFLRHLKRVIAICQKYGLKPMIWSDMFFRIFDKDHNYYVSEMEVTEEMRKKVPQDVQLIFWDYYHWEEKYYLDMIRIHNDFGFKPIMASMIWTPARLWYDHGQTKLTVPPCINASEQTGLDELIFTLWGDDGAYCDFDSAMAGLTFSAAEAWKSSKDTLQKQYQLFFGGDYEKVIAASALTVDQPEQFTAGLAAADIIWDDPLLWIGCRNAEQRYPGVLNKMKEQCRNAEIQLTGAETKGGGDLDHAKNLCNLMILKINLYQRMKQKLLDSETALMAEEAALAADRVISSFRRQWMRRNKPFGMHVVQIRLAGLADRFREVSRRIQENSSFPELDLPDSPVAFGTGNWHLANLVPKVN